jgi:hypothetical protein
MKKVALIQNEQFFTPALQKLYLANIPVLTSKDVKEIYKFIIKNAKKNCILKYVLNINSGELDQFIDYISLKKEKGTICCLINKCTFIATRSNATSVRKKNILKGTNIYFTLTPISEILNNIKDDRMFIVSDTQNPYYDEIYNFKKTNNYRISEITDDILNQYTEYGSAITCALNSQAEFSNLVSLILKSKYRRLLQFIEIKNLDIIKPLINVMFTNTNTISGSGIIGNIFRYPEFNIDKMYENTSLMLVNLVSEWGALIKNELVSKKICNYGIVIFYLNNSNI